LSIIDRFLRSRPDFPPKDAHREQAVLIYVEGEGLEGSIPVQEELIFLLEASDAGIFDGMKWAEES
jgi:hypothetical protein